MPNERSGKLRIGLKRRLPTLVVGLIACLAVCIWLALAVVAPPAGVSGWWTAGSGAAQDQGTSGEVGHASVLSDRGATVGGSGLAQDASSSATQGEQGLDAVDSGDAQVEIAGRDWMVDKIKLPEYRKAYWNYDAEGRVESKEYFCFYSEHPFPEMMVTYEYYPNGAVRAKTQYSWDDKSQSWRVGDDWFTRALYRWVGGRSQINAFFLHSAYERAGGDDAGEGWLDGLYYSDSLGMPAGAPGIMDDGNPYNWMAPPALSVDLDGRSRVRSATWEGGNGSEGGFSYAYDSEGRLAAIRSGARDDGQVVEERSYDGQGRLERIVSEGSSFTTFAYDGQGRIAVQGIGVDVSGEGADAAGQPLTAGSG